MSGAVLLKTTLDSHIHKSKQTRNVGQCLTWWSPCRI